MKNIIPTPTEFAREAVLVLGGLLIAAFVLSRFPKLREWVSAQSITIKDPNNKPLW